ncbi:MAG: DUF3322 domain-containing protein [Verrucomicrobiota bacterium]
MISPAEIRDKVARKYRDVLRSHVRREVEALFPMVIRGNRKVGSNLADAALAIEALRKESLAERGFGYEIEWEERNSRQFGKNPFPKRIVIPSRDDFLRLIGKRAEFERFTSRIDDLQRRFPELGSWLETNVMRVIRSEPNWEGLIEVVEYFRYHPVPGVFARELPLRVDSKFIERHQSELRPLLETILPESAIDPAEKDFDRRFGLRPFEAMIRMRFLDPELQRVAGVAQEEFGLPVDQLSRITWPVQRVIIVENARCLLTLPLLPSSRVLGLFGHGYRVSNFSRISWMKNCEINYSGDIDAQGFEILSLLREYFPQTKSVGMNREIFEDYRNLCSAGTVSRNQRPSNLSEEEAAMSSFCRRENLRLEQERIPPLSISFQDLAMEN